MLFPRVFVATAVIAPTVARALVPYLAVPFAIGIAALAIWWRKNRPHPSAPEMPPNPLQMGPALQMAATFQVVFFVAEFARRLFGTSGLLASAAILGLTDVDALTISMARMPPALVTPGVAARAIALGVLVNCALKTAVAITLGTPRFRRVVAATLTAMAIAIAVSIGALR
jgi:uncharacterized membrane protein (DUF4010 family)